MSELLDVFDDENLLDFETRSFLVEALANAEENEWQDILEPFVNQEPALAVLRSVPNVLQRSLKALERSPDNPTVAIEISASAQAFLDALGSGAIVYIGLHTLARCAPVCRSTQTIASRDGLWMDLTERSCKSWKLPSPQSLELVWRLRFFSLLHPRCDGIYVGEAGYLRHVRIGQHMDMRKNAVELAKGGRNGCTTEWIGYRRYVRLMPRDASDGTFWALVVQDACPRKVAEQVLIAGVDPRTHVNPTKGGQRDEFDDLGAKGEDKDRIEKKICLGKYTFVKDEISIRYIAGENDFSLTFRLGLGPRRFADRLEWTAYTMTPTGGQSDDVIAYDLGKLPDWQGGGLANPDKDHFPPLDFRPQACLEHLL
jgi:hypothetical protein